MILDESWLLCDQPRVARNRGRGEWMVWRVEEQKRDPELLRAIADAMILGRMPHHLGMNHRWQV